ncbi:HlyD family efflux transporter periplasmic adaptor subunit [Pseudonocardia sp. McavD-2-B]|uniref:HlyD family efflux transporter periplasmic adaptor subunit n=1 Tax=Pseudonocardia sp. McavD-2-B TaxID=2954499 RepID=UPI00209730EA|nr:HlyD family efflux transporter periplasmic adaptor subunit [Pseudonocardia sp. McavD-2-B]MCO7191432.1 HlyD family efflux transporter periplasmic adaptor subunit [Pseudonocardia sp. McavD-2-B]
MTRLRLAGSLLLAGLVGLTACTGGDQPPPTAVVDRGVVSTGVSASGSLVSITQQNLGFTDGGRVTELLVEVGETVAAGQPLARLDDAEARSQVAAAQAGLDQQQASLGKLTGANTVEAAQASLASAESVLAATRDQVGAQNAANDTAVERARVQLAFDRKQLAAAQEKLETDRRACKRSGGSTASATPEPTADPSGGGLLGGLSGGSGTSGGSGLGAATTDPACTAVATDEQAVTTAKGQVITSQTALAQAEGTRDTGAASGRVSIANAESAVSDARSQLTGANNDAPADVAVQDAVVADARNTLADAQRALDDTLLRAPVAGTVSAINGAVGDVVPAASAATALAPGTDARIPQAVGSASAASGGAGAVGGGASAAGGAPFLTLNDLQTYQLVVPFEESDAARVAPNQTVDVTVDALPGVSLPATVVAVAPTATQLSGVVSYYATVVLNRTDPQLRDGQTAQADVRTEARNGVLRVPNTAVRQEGGRSVVDVPGDDGAAVTRQFVPGLVGDQFTEVRSGLDDGQQVLLPQATVEATPGRPGGGPGGGGQGGN